MQVFRLVIKQYCNMIIINIILSRYESKLNDILGRHEHICNKYHACLKDHCCNASKRLVFFISLFLKKLTAHNICLTHFTPLIVISANALGYILLITVEFVIRNMMSIF